MISLIDKELFFHKMLWRCLPSDVKEQLYCRISLLKLHHLTTKLDCVIKRNHKYSSLYREKGYERERWNQRMERALEKDYVLNYTYYYQVRILRGISD
ncbi:hypothetical protein NPIL_509861 [Nephila pilipes]|uniref:Uncharacterized protein n=1 Tax=Nephila pilipes TaxID=299642 RepID=A0A8X6NBU2_NEPPI|nr:hypothetical protein NPIL_509861 [Nephila pilipes]